MLKVQNNNKFRVAREKIQCPLNVLKGGESYSYLVLLVSQPNKNGALKPGGSLKFEFFDLEDVEHRSKIEANLSTVEIQQNSRESRGESQRSTIYVPLNSLSLEEMKILEFERCHKKVTIVVGLLTLSAKMCTVRERERSSTTFFSYRGI